MAVKDRFDLALPNIASPVVSNRNLASGGKYRGIGSPEGVIPAGIGATYFDETSEDTWTKKTNHFGKSGWVIDSDSESTVISDGTTEPRPLSERFSETLNVLDVGCSPSAGFDNLGPMRLAFELAATTSKKLIVPDGHYEIYADDEDVLLTCDALPADNKEFNDFWVEGYHAGSRPTNIASTIYTRGAVFIFKGDLAGKTCIQTGAIVTNFVMKNIALIGTGLTVDSIALEHNVASSGMTVENCTFQHFGKAIDIGGDYATAGDTHADFNRLIGVHISFCEYGVIFNNHQGAVNELYSCYITARICVSNAKSMDGLTQSPAVSIYGGFYAPHAANNGDLFQGTVTSAVGQTITVSNALTRKVMTWQSDFTPTVTTTASTTAAVASGMYLIAEKNCNLTGSTRVNEWGVINKITGVASDVMTVTGLVDTTALATMRVWIFKPAIAFFGDAFNVNGVRIERATNEVLEIGSIVAYLSGWQGNSTFTNCHVKMFETGDFCAVLPKFVHIPIYAFHGSPLILEKNRFEITNPKCQVSAEFGMHTYANVWNCEPLILNQLGKLAEGVYRTMDSHVSKARTYAFSAADLRSRLLQMGPDRFLQKGGILTRVEAIRSVAPTAGSTGDIYTVNSGNEAAASYSIGSANAIEAYYETTSPTATGAVDVLIDDPSLITLTGDYTGLYPEQAIAITGIGVAGATLQCRILDIRINTGTSITTRKIWISVPASTTNPTATITASPASAVIHNRDTFGSSDASLPVATFWGGAGGTDLVEFKRTAVVTQSFTMRVGAGIFTVRDKTAARDLVVFTNESASIAMRSTAGISLQEQAGYPTAAELTSGANAKDRVSMQMVGDKMVFTYNDGAGAVNYLSIPLDGSTTTWTHGSSAP